MARKKTHEEYVGELSIKNPNIIPIEDYRGARDKILHKCLVCNHKWHVVPSSVVKGIGCPNCSNKATGDRCRKTHEEFLIELYEINKNIEVLSKYNTSKNAIEVKCLNCSGIWLSTPNKLLSGRGCPYCCNANRKILIGFNDLRTTEPDIANLLLNPEDGYKYSRCSSIKVDWKCPSCNSIIYNKSIYSVTNKRKLPCAKCSDGISYPNKFMFSLLQQLDIEFETEKSFSWSKLNSDNKYSKAKYDFYFWIRDQKYIVEMDGRWHFDDNNLSFQTKEKSMLIDSLKNDLAKKHNIFLIRIDCRKSDFDYIMYNIINSKLTSILNLDAVNWFKCHNDSIKSYKIDAAEMWNGGLTTGEIARIMKKSRHTIVHWLKDCAVSNICSYNAVDGKKRSNQKKGHSFKCSKCCLY